MVAAAAVIQPRSPRRQVQGPDSGSFRRFCPIDTTESWSTRQKMTKTKAHQNDDRRRSLPARKRPTSESRASTPVSLYKAQSSSPLQLTRASSLPERSPSPQGDHLIDPFSTSLSASKKTDFLLRFFSTAHMARYYWSDNLIAEHNKHVVSLAMCEPVLFNSLMAKTLTDIKCGRGNLLNDFVPEGVVEDGAELAVADFSYYKMRTMQCLQECLAVQEGAQIQAAAVLAIILIVKEEVMGGSVDEVRLHLSAFRRLVKSGVTLDWLSPTARSPSLFTINIACAVTQQVPPLAPAACFDSDLPEKISHAMGRHSVGALEHLCHSFDNPDITQLLGPKLLCYISSQRDFVLFKELSLLGHLSTSVVDYGAASSMMHRADYHLLSLPFLHKLTPMQEAVRLALLISNIAVIIGLPQKTLLVKSLGSQLKKAMQNTMCSLGDNDDRSVNELLLWVYFVGAHVSLGLKERPWFLVQLIKTMSTLGIRSQQQVCAIMMGYLYTERLFARACGSIWEDMEELAEDLGLRD